MNKRGSFLVQSRIYLLPAQSAQEMRRFKGSYVLEELLSMNYLLLGAFLELRSYVCEAAKGLRVFQVTFIS